MVEKENMKGVLYWVASCCVVLYCAVLCESSPQVRLGGSVASEPVVEIQCLDWQVTDLKGCSR